MADLSRSRIVAAAGIALALAAWWSLDRRAPVEGPAAIERERVVLLHGLGRGIGSMATLEAALDAAGYEVHNLGYPSRDKTPDELLTLLSEELETCCLVDDRPLHFVTHSLGGILVRALLEVERPRQLGRVVMLAPPNQGSEVVDSLGESWLFRTVMGPTAEELGTGPGSLPNRLGPPDYPLGILASNRSINPIGSWLLPGEDDGSVKVEAMRIEGMTDFRVLPATHTFIMRDPDAIRQTLNFLRYGRFAPHAADDNPDADKPEEGDDE